MLNSVMFQGQIYTKQLASEWVWLTGAGLYMQCNIPEGMRPAFETVLQNGDEVFVQGQLWMGPPRSPNPAGTAALPTNVKPWIPSDAYIQVFAAHAIRPQSRAKSANQILDTQTNYNYRAHLEMGRLQENYSKQYSELRQVKTELAKQKQEASEAILSLLSGGTAQ